MKAYWNRLSILIAHFGRIDFGKHLRKSCWVYQSGES